MFEGSRLGYIVPGYTGHLPKVLQNDPLQIEKKEAKYQVPGYAGYIPSVKAENMFGKSYGKITYTISEGTYYQGQDVPPDMRYNSMQKDTFVNQREVLQRTAAEIVGVKPSQAKYSVTVDKIQNSKFWGEQGEGKEQIQGAQKNAQSSQSRPENFDGSAAKFFGYEDKQPLKLGQPLPGYTGVIKRVQAANIFGQTYANAMRSAQRDEQNINNEKINNFKNVSQQIPKIVR